jgi:MFS family permease
MQDAKAGHRGVLAIFFLNGALFGAWASRVPAIKADLAMDEAELGLVLLCMAAGAVISFPLSGRGTDALGAPTICRLTALVYVPLLPLLGLAPASWVLAPALLLFGAAFGSMDVAMNAWGADVERARGRPIMSGLHGFFSLGAGAGAGAGALFAAAGAPPWLHFILFAAGIAAVTLPFAWTKWPAERRVVRSRAPILAIPRGALLAVGVIAFCASMGEGGMADWSAVYLAEVLAAGEDRAAIGYAVFSVAMVATRFAGDILIARLGRVAVARICGVVAAAGAAAVALSPSVIVGWAGMGALGIGYALVAPLVFSRAASDPHVPPGAAVAAVSTLAYGGMLLGPPVIGFIGHAAGLRFSFGLLALLALAIVVLARRLAQPGR